MIISCCYPALFAWDQDTLQGLSGDIRDLGEIKPHVTLAAFQKKKKKGRENLCKALVKLASSRAPKINGIPISRGKDCCTSVKECAHLQITAVKGPEEQRYTLTSSPQKRRCIWLRRCLPAHKLIIYIHINIATELEINKHSF